MDQDSNLAPIDIALMLTDQERRALRACCIDGRVAWDLNAPAFDALENEGLVSPWMNRVLGGWVKNAAPTDLGMLVRAAMDEVGA